MEISYLMLPQGVLCGIENGCRRSIKASRADVVTMRTKQGMERWLCEWAMVNRLGSSLKSLQKLGASKSKGLPSNLDYYVLNGARYG